MKLYNNFYGVAVFGKKFRAIFVKQLWFLDWTSTHSKFFIIFITKLILKIAIYNKILNQINQQDDITW